ncbi:MAG: exo-alpha-sialidase [Verrucomicrobia bacterium]|nr:exo-alpha-sialidase [Verrucomicrobiota bacterium]
MNKPFKLSSITSIAQIQHGMRRYPTLYMLPNGDWLVPCHWEADTHFARRMFLRSTDHGQTWRDEDAPVPRENGLIALRNGEVLAFDNYPMLKQDDEYIVGASWSKDGGRSFGPMELATIHAPDAEPWSLQEMMSCCWTTAPEDWTPIFEAAGHRNWRANFSERIRKIMIGGPPPSRAALEREDGSIVALNWYHPKGQKRVPGLFVLESRDRGRSWRQIALVVSGDGLSEPSLAQLDNGDLLALNRTGGPLLQARSSDGGFTWSKPQPVRFAEEFKMRDTTPYFSHLVQRMRQDGAEKFACGVAPDMIRMSDGTLVCVYGRPGFHMMYDLTGTGEHWRHGLSFDEIEFDLCRRNGSPCCDFGSTGYMGVQEVAPGELAVVYDLQNWTESRGKPRMRWTIRCARLTRR